MHKLWLHFCQTRLTFSPVSFETFLFASMSHLLPSNIRLTPAEAFWEERAAMNWLGSVQTYLDEYVRLSADTFK